MLFDFLPFAICNKKFYRAGETNYPALRFEKQ